MEKSNNETFHEKNVKKCSDFYSIAKKSRYRVCVANDQRALFHRWAEQREVVEPSAFVGGHPGGEVAITYGIVEKMDGQIIKCYPENIKFLDTADYTPEL